MGEERSAKTIVLADEMVLSDHFERAESEGPESC